jgi:virulence-associated protein VagC
MTESKKAKLSETGGLQVVILPEGIHLDGDEVYVSQDDATGTVTLSPRTSQKRWQEMFAYMDSLDVPQEDLDAYMADRPMNRPPTFRDVFEDEE